MENEWDACLSTLEGHNNSDCSVAWLHDAALLASVSSHNTVKIWDAKTGRCVSTLEIGRFTSCLQFALADPSLLHTDVGIFHFQPMVTSTAIAPTAMAVTHSRPSSPRSFTNTRKAYGLTRDSTWIMFGGQNVLWLPPEFRPQCLAISGSAAALGYTSGRVLVFQFAKRPPWLGDE